MQCPGTNPVRVMTDTLPPPISVYETKLEIADGIAVTEKGRKFLFRLGGRADSH